MTLSRTFCSSAVGIGEIADADAAPRDLVLVGRPDAARGGADLALAAARLRQQVEVAVIRQDEVRLVADDQPAGRRRCRPRSARRSPRRAPVGSTTTPLPMTQMTPGCRMPDGISRRTNFVPFDVDGMPGVVSALIARDDVEVRREQVDDLALAFVAPLRAEHCKIHSVVPSIDVIRYDRRTQPHDRIRLRRSRACDTACRSSATRAIASAASHESRENMIFFSIDNVRPRFLISTLRSDRLRRPWSDCNRQ